ncbi:MAG: family 10 glycosylhydrolase [Verrucomicrobiales bacterium]|nr:family 10 glycosylhydrolase [Verrucomicrobiales bacterium]
MKALLRWVPPPGFHRLQRNIRILLALTALALKTSFLCQPAKAGEELRGLWVDTFHPGFRNPSEVDTMVRLARTAGFNALFVEVRKRGDAYYTSRHEPRAVDLAPDFDPLDHLLRLAHDTQLGPRLEVHAWVVTYTIWNQRRVLPAQPDHPFRLHPDWLSRNVQGATWDGREYAFDPGHPEVQEHTFNVAMDLIRRYDLDGFHWDYVRYNGRDWGYNRSALERFHRLYRRKGKPRPDDPDWMQFRREQVTDLVRKVYLTALAERPSVKISAATIAFAPGIEERTDWPTSAAFSDVLQDWRAWLQEGILDLSIPMTYFRSSENEQDWLKWSRFIRDHQYQRRTAIGIGGYLNPASVVLAQMRETRSPSVFGTRTAGLCLYSFASPTSDQTAAEFFAGLATPTTTDPSSTPVFAEPASVPTAPWKTSTRSAHLKGTVRCTDGSSTDGARVVYCGPVGGFARVDGTGFFGIVDLPPGDYLWRVEMDRRRSADQESSLTGGKVVHVDVTISSETDPQESTAPAEVAP